MYFIDELNGGNIYRYTSAASFGDDHVGQAPTTSRPARPSSCASATATRRTPRARSPGFRSPTPTGAALPGALTITDVNGVTSVDARNTTNLAAFKGTDYQRPEDMQIQTVQWRRVSLRDDDHHERGLRAQPEDEHDLRLREPEHHRPGHGPCGGLRAGQPRQSGDRPRREHLHHRGPQRRRRRRHLVRQGPEQGRRSDRPGRRHRRAGPPTARSGSEFTGLYFDPTDKRRAWVNIQHPGSGNDRTIEITLP